MYQTLIMKFFFQWPWTSPNDLGQGHDTPLGHGQSLCEMRTYQKSLSIRKIWTRYGLWNFSSSDLELPQMTLGQGHDIPLGHGQSLWEMRTYQVIHKKDMDWTQIMKFFFQWPWSSPNDLGSRSWHTLRSWAILVWNETLPSLSIRKILTGLE